MTGMQFVRGAAFGVATIGLALPQTEALAGPSPAGAKANSKPSQPASLEDVALGSGGTLVGRLVDQSGTPIDGAQVTLHQGKLAIGQTITSKDGRYSFTNLRGGVYRVTSADTQGVFRVWADKTAPPVAKDHALLVTGQNNARGQLGAISAANLLLAGGATSAVGLSAVTIDRVNHVNTSAMRTSAAGNSASRNTLSAPTSNANHAQMPINSGGSSNVAGIPKFIAPQGNSSGAIGTGEVKPIADYLDVKPVSP